MFGKKLRATIAASASTLANATDRQTRIIRAEMHEYNKQVSRSSNAAEVANDLKLMEMGYTSQRPIPTGVRLHCLWEPTLKTKENSITSWGYREAIVTYGTIDYNEILTCKCAPTRMSFHDYQIKSPDDIKARDIYNLLKAYGHGDDFNIEWSARPDVMQTEIILKGKVTGFWSNFEAREFYNIQTPRWWKVA